MTLKPVTRVDVRHNKPTCASPHEEVPFGRPSRDCAHVARLRLHDAGCGGMRVRKFEPQVFCDTGADFIWYGGRDIHYWKLRVHRTSVMRGDRGGNDGAGCNTTSLERRSRCGGGQPEYGWLRGHSARATRREEVRQLQSQ